jgi:DNA-binding transcriptional regulator YiaG
MNWTSSARHRRVLETCKSACNDKGAVMPTTTVFPSKRSVAGRRIKKAALVSKGSKAPKKSTKTARKNSPALHKLLNIRVVKVDEVRTRLGLSQPELARITGYSVRAIAGWEGGKPLSEAARQRVVETERLRQALAEIIPANKLGEWMRTPNPAFEGQTPIQVIERGESDRIWRMIFQIDANVAS